MRKIILVLLIIFLFGCQTPEVLVEEETKEPKASVTLTVLPKEEQKLCCCKIGEGYEVIQQIKCTTTYKSQCFDDVFCEEKEIKQVCCYYPGGNSKITSLYDCMQTGMRWTNDMEKCGQDFEEVEAVYPDRPKEVALLPADKVCCLVPMHAYHPYEKAFDTTVQRCEQMKGKILPWEKCYEVVCCNRQGRLSLRKFMDCKTEMAEIEEMEKCKSLQPTII